MPQEEFVPEDPMGLIGMVMPGEPGQLEAMAECFIEEYVRLAKEEGIFAGFSSGANVSAAMQLLKTTCKGKTIVVLLSDSGLKYLSTDLWL